MRKEEREKKQGNIVYGHSLNRGRDQLRGAIMWLVHGLQMIPFS